MKHYFQLWALLLAAFIVIVAYSCLDSDKRLSLGDVEIKSSGIADRLTQQPDTTAKADSGLLASDMKKEAAIPAPVDTATQSILIIGDSMLEGLNPALGAYAKHNGHKLNSVIWYSSTSEYWGNSDTLRVYLNQFKPTFIFISLGANELFVSDIKEKRDKFVKSLIRQIGDIPYVWIGPPNWKKDTGINEMIVENVPQGRYFKSDGMHFDREKDGAHPTHASAKLWMDSIARWMPLHAEHPIRLDAPPADVKGRPDRVVVLQPLR